MKQEKNYTGWDMIKAIGSAILILGVFYLGAQKWDLTFDDQNEKIRNKQHLKNIGTESDFAIEKERNKKFQEDMYKYIEQDLKDTKDLKKHVHNTDSVLKIEAELNRLNADQIFQIKENTRQ